MAANDSNLIWIDLEMTGLDPERDRIIEIATLVTDAHLNILAEGPVMAVHQFDAQLALMDDWNVRTHTGSGLVDRVKASPFDDNAAQQKLSTSCESGFLRANRRFAATASARTDVFCLNICRSWKPISITVIWTSAR